MRYRALHEAIRAVSTASSLHESAPALLRALSVGLDWTLASLLIVDQDASSLRVLDLWAPDPEHAAFVEVTRQISFVPGEGLPGRSWVQNQSLWLEDVREEPAYIRRAVARDTGLATGVWVPLRAQGTVVGILELYSEQRRPVDEALLAHLEDFGAILGMAVRRLQDTALLTEREERIRATIDAALDAVISIDAAGLVTEWNPQAESLFGWSADEARGRLLGTLIVPERLRDGHRAGMARLIATGQPRVIGKRLEMPAVDRSGREFPVELTLSAHQTGGQPSFSAFLRDLTDRLAAEIERERSRQALAEANIELADAADHSRALAAEADTANQAKGDFLATMSHEIRTPLSGILGMVELLQGTRLAAEEQHYLDVMRSSGEALLSIINEILDFSKVESGQLDIRPVPFSPKELIAEVAALFRPTARAKGLSVRTIVDSGVPERVEGDVGLISQVLRNLVSNAIKFTDTGSVTIRLSSLDHQHLKLSVADTGIGIARPDLDRLFEPFVQLDSSPARRFGGSGLGLAITQRLIHGMGGTIDVTTAPGSGSTFIVVLPVLPAATDVTKAPDDTRPTPPVAKRRRRGRVLVVDDNPVNRELATMLLTRMGHQAIAVADGEAALRRIERGLDDLVLLDCQLPGLDGFAVTRRVREFEATNHRRRMPIVAMTANAYAAGRHRALAAGMDGYITKPYRPKDLEAMVDQWLGGHGDPQRSRAIGPATAEPVPATDTMGRVASNQPSPSGEPGEPTAPGVLGELEVIAGMDVVCDLVRLFVSTSQEAEVHLRVAAAGHDHAALAREAHSLRGSAATVGADELATACTQLEHAAMAGQGRLDADVDAVLSTLETTRAELERWLAEATPRLGTNEPSRPEEAGP